MCWCERRIVAIANTQIHINREIPSWILLWWQFEWSFGKFVNTFIANGRLHHPAQHNTTQHTNTLTSEKKKKNFIGRWNERERESEAECVYFRNSRTVKIYWQRIAICIFAVMFLRALLLSCFFFNPRQLSFSLLQSQIQTHCCRKIYGLLYWLSGIFALSVCLFVWCRSYDCYVFARIFLLVFLLHMLNWQEKRKKYPLEVSIF